MSRRSRAVLRLAVLPLAIMASAPAPGATLYSEDFESNPAASWTINAGPGDHAVDFFFDYSTIGIPAAPSGTGTRGLKLQANLASAIFSGVSVSPTGKSFTGTYTVAFDWWANFNGPFPNDGDGSTQLSTFGIQTSGTAAQWPSSTELDSIWFAATGDGGSSSDWRAYSPLGRYADTAPGIYAAGASPTSTNASDPYYAGFGGVTAPAAQSALYGQQSGTTQIGSAGMAWHQAEIRVSTTTATWIVDGLTIATVPLADDTVDTGHNIFFGHADTNGALSDDPDAAALLFTLIDNVHVIATPVPEPSAAVMLLVGIAGIAGLRKSRR